MLVNSSHHVQSCSFHNDVRVNNTVELVFMRQDGSHFCPNVPITASLLYSLQLLASNKKGKSVIQKLAKYSGCLSLYDNDDSKDISDGGTLNFSFLWLCRVRWINKVGIN